MRKVLVVLAVVFTTSIFTVGGVDAATATTKHKARHHVSRTHKATMVSCPKPKAKRAHYGRGKTTKRHYRRATYGRGPLCPAPIVNVPAPVVNVPQQAAPVVNIPPEQPGVGVTTDASNIYVLRGNTLTILRKCDNSVIGTVNLP